MLNKFLDYISTVPNQFFAVSSAERSLAEKGFLRLYESEPFSLEVGGRYYIKRNNSSLIAFTVGKNILAEGFRIIASHTDSPSIVIKPDSEISSEGCIKLNTECYGGLILSTWFDRPLSIAGRVIYKEDDKIKERLIDLGSPVLTIPSLAIHLDREINNGHKIDKQKELLPIIALAGNDKDEKFDLTDILSSEFSIDKKDILDYELSLYDTEKPCFLGLNKEFISSRSIDDLSMVYTSLKAFEESDFSSTSVLALVDNEEIGSRTAQGADGSFISAVLERIALAFSDKREYYFSSLARSLMVSADVAHAVHPNYPDKSDITSRVYMGKGIVIKYSAPKKYGTDGISSSVFTDICRSSDIKYQKFTNNSNIPGGSTIGSMTSAALGIPVIDMGIPVLAMHSVRELCAASDITDSYKFFKSFYSYRLSREI
ncbi:MAG: M18 family aminopeptidase [Firmicutes bacterium]|nr:M18 family aminopeptidase [Bacillota bacterium]